MGDIAEMMLDGTLCEGCGKVVGGAVGYPRECRQCEKDFKPVAKKKPRVRCPCATSSSARLEWAATLRTGTMAESESVQHYIEVLEAYGRGEIILVKDLNHFGGWRPKKSGTPWLFGIESYIRDSIVVVAVDQASPAGDKSVTFVGIRSPDGSVEIREYVEK